MAKVLIAFDADPAKIGTTTEVPDEEARVLVKEGRATYAGNGAAKKSSKASDKAKDDQAQ